MEAAKRDGDSGGSSEAAATFGAISDRVERMLPKAPRRCFGITTVPDKPSGTFVCPVKGQTMRLVLETDTMSGKGKSKDFELGRIYLRNKVKLLQSVTFSLFQDLDFSISQFPRYRDKEDIEEELMRPEYSSVPPGFQIRNVKDYGRTK